LHASERDQQGERKNLTHGGPALVAAMTLS
jgi:hypothetical protein